MKWRGGLSGPLIWPPDAPCNSEHQDYYMFSRGFLLTFTFHCYMEGAISNIYLFFSSNNPCIEYLSLGLGDISTIYMLVNHGKPTMHGSISCQL